MPEWRNELYKYITGIIHNNKHKLIVINGIGNHIHILAGINPISRYRIYCRTSRGIHQNGLALSFHSC
ncbi:MAG: transposase, partial [Chitinispirillaceae bacterium]|nr:transposase [Chitinispirillaceae bacterium]